MSTDHSLFHVLGITSESWVKYFMFWSKCLMLYFVLPSLLYAIKHYAITSM